VAGASPWEQHRPCSLTAAQVDLSGHLLADAAKGESPVVPDSVAAQCTLEAQVWFAARLAVRC
jgi:hypothetical protein